MISPPEFAKLIDHTDLKPDATVYDVKKLCMEARQYEFKNVCVNPTYTRLAAEQLENTGIGVCVVIGFPLGMSTSKTKALEAKEAIFQGASELDMVINIGCLKSGSKKRVEEDIQGVVNGAEGKPVKVILETALLTTEEKIEACLIAKKAGARFVKTSTGFLGLEGAKVEDVRLLRETVGSEMGVKASGGIRDLKTVMEMLDAGADRIGTSSGVQIMKTMH